MVDGRSRLTDGDLDRIARAISETSPYDWQSIRPIVEMTGEARARRIVNVCAQANLGIGYGEWMAGILNPEHYGLAPGWWNEPEPPHLRPPWNTASGEPIGG